MRNTWLEVPAAWFEIPEQLALLLQAQRAGHQLLRQASFGDLRGELVAPLQVRSMLKLLPEDALAISRLPNAVALDSLRPPLREQLLAGVVDRQLAARCLDEAGAWGLLGWPDEDVLHAHREQPLACSGEVIAQIFRAMDDECSLDQLERLVRQDPVLVYRLLSLVNSSAYGLKRNIQSLRHAFMLLGFGALGRWLSEQLNSADTDPELHPVRYAMVMRSRLAQHLLESGAEDDLRAEVYATALFAQLDRLLHQPLATLLHKLPLAERVFDALLRASGPYHPLLEIARLQGDPALLRQLPAMCERFEMSLEHVNRSLLRMLASSRDHARAVPAVPDPIAALSRSQG